TVEESRLTLPSSWKKKGEDRCPVCLEEAVGDTVVLSCMHTFHRSCIPRDLVERCPLCKMTMNDLSWLESRKARMERVKNSWQEEEEEEEDDRPIATTPERNSMTLRKRKRNV